MEREFVVYLGNCVFSNFLTNKYKHLIQALLRLPHRLAFSEVHLFEMRNNSDEYAGLLEELNAVFVRNPWQNLGRYHPISCFEPAYSFQRFSEYSELSPVYEAMESILLPMQHLLAGNRDSSMSHIAQTVGTHIKSSINEIFASIDIDFQDRASKHFEPQIDDITQTISGVATTDSWKKMDAQFDSARMGDPMRDMTPQKKVAHLISCLPASDKQEFEKAFPKKFAGKLGLEVGEVAAFAMGLFAMGLTKRKGIFRGPNQNQKFAAQFRDALHIEQASRCDIFLTADQGAFDLAACCFAYAGFRTQCMLMKLE